MSARRASTRRKDREARRAWARRLARRGLIGAAAVALIGALAWGAGRLADPSTLPIRTVHVEGAFRHLEAARVREAVGPAARGGFFSVDVSAVRRAAEGLPWVAHATVRRVWPDRLNVQVSEHEPLARWGDDGVVSREGVVFRPASDAIPDGLPQLRGPEHRAQALVSRYHEVGRRLEPLGLEIAGVTEDARRALQLLFDNGTELRLGSRAPRARLARFTRVYPHIGQARREVIDYVDLRYTNGLAVGWREGRRPGDGQAEGG